MRWTKTLIEKYNVLIFSNYKCRTCRKAKTYIDEAGIKHGIVELELLHNGENIHRHLKNITSIETTPHIFVKGKYIGGANELYNMTKSGEFQKLLDKANVTYNFTKLDEEEEEI